MRAVVGIGANLGDRLATMRAAVLAIAGVPGITLSATSSVYETVPVGGVPQPEFLNAAIVAECTLSPFALLDALQRIEAELGRTRGAEDIRWGPRTIDLDVLWIDGITVDEPRLVVPHPRLVERAFALVPLLEVAPDAPFVAPESSDVRVTSLTL